MVDLRERLAKKKLQKATSPIDIYNSLDRMASKGELRKAQKEILENWYKYRKDDKDLSKNKQWARSLFIFMS